MKRKITFLMTAALLTAAFFGTAYAESFKCSECGMKADAESRFTARIEDAGKNLYFCDIGDLFVYLNRNKKQDVRIQVRDYVSGDWTSGQSAYYVQSSQKFFTPMGWGIAAFRDRKQAQANGTALPFDTAVTVVK